MSTGIKLITLDLDNTLWDVDSIIVSAEADMRAWLAAHVPDSLAHYNAEALGEIRADVAARHKDKVHDLSYMRTRVLEAVMLRAGYASNEAKSLATQAFEVFFAGRNRVEFYPGAREALADLSARYPIYALTNGNADIERAGLTDWVTGAYSSALVGRSKPHADMFHAPLRDLGLSANQAIHVGDNLVDDIHGANNVGMYSIWVNLTAATTTDAPSPPHREITHLEDLAVAVASIDS